ncbi:MAG: DUF805 domain-containing protein [Asticcacaulis sp.]|nr:DUF805 domain-containing protein [Asticcacaulis sp.]
MGFGQAIQSAYKNYFQFNGRASRSEFWWFYLFNLLVVIAGLVFFMIVGAATSGQGQDAQAGVGIATGLIGLVWGLFVLGSFFPTLSLIVRRLHDSDKSGWFLLLIFVPFGGIVLLVFYCLPGTVGANQFGEDPLRRPESIARAF